MSTSMRGYVNDAQRWAAVQARDPEAEGVFWISVATTGVYCYPTCPSRLPRRENVAFHATRAEAEQAGFRACKRCRPELPPRRRRHAEAVARARRLIEAAGAGADLRDCAAEAGLSPGAFARRFREITGHTLLQFARLQAADRAAAE